MSLPFSSLDAPSILHARSTGLSALPPSRYREDFLELGVLGRGGFGTVYHVFHNIDRCEYAVKKIPIRPSLMAKIATGGQAVLDTVLAEVRSLSRLQHPNIVRYYSSWIEWSTVDNPELTSDGTISGTGGYTDAVADVGNSRSTVLASLSRIRYL
jgi:translation initiation factor 2-alpha kinase 3